MRPDPDLTEEEEGELRAQVSASKGVGNFRSMFVNIPNGKENAIQIIPLGDFQTRGELEKVKNITRNDRASAWRTNPALAGITPDNGARFGDIEKIDRVNEVLRADRHATWHIPEAPAEGSLI